MNITVKTVDRAVPEEQLLHSLWKHRQRGYVYICVEVLRSNHTIRLHSLSGRCHIWIINKSLKDYVRLSRIILEDPR